MVHYIKSDIFLYFPFATLYTPFLKYASMRHFTLNIYKFNEGEIVILRYNNFRKNIFNVFTENYDNVLPVHILA